MKFTRDIRRLLGLGGDGPGEEDMDVQNESSKPSESRKDPDLSQATLNGEEGLDDVEKTRRRAERRRAKRKRQKERKKLEKEERTEDVSEQGEDVPGVVSESDSEEELKAEEEWTAVRPKNKCSPESVLRTAGNKSNRKSEEEPEWDVRSAFVANAASHIKLKGLKSRTLQVSRYNDENEARSSQVATTEEMKRRGESLAVQGIQMYEQGQYSQAVDMFTEAICCDPKDHRFYGNRSSCYCCLEQYSSALTDAQRAIQLAPDWPMGYCHKACALMGLKELGFEEEQSKLLLEKFITVQAVLTSPDAKVLKQDRSGSCRSLWVGNITLEVSEKDLLDLFKTCGEIESIRVLYERFCAFINFKNANMAATALEKLQGVELGNSKLVMRYPDRWIQRTVPSIQRTTAGLSSSAAGSKRRLATNGVECFYWRTTGCDYGDKCRFKHVPAQQGRNKKP
ncbi:hypothetical protein PAMA_016746 [Pampus argenteus]